MEYFYEMVGRMASDRLWIYTAIVGSLFGLAFSTYFKGTRIGIWCYSKFDSILDFKCPNNFQPLYVSQFTAPGVTLSKFNFNKSLTL